MIEDQSMDGAPAILPSDVVAWLQRSGWREAARLGDIATMLESLEHRVVVPMRPTSSDFVLRWAEMEHSLAGAFETDEAGVRLAIVKSGSDIAEFRASGDQGIDDSMPLGDAEVFIASVRRAMQASANSALQPRGYFGHSLPEAAREYARNVRMGQTRRGSYIVPVISRVPILEPDDDEDSQLFEAPAYEPFARKAMLRLADGLAALRELSHGTTMPTGDKIAESVGAGVSHELSQAIAATLATPSLDALGVKFSWADQLPTKSAPTALDFEQGALPIVQGISNYLRGNRVVGEQMIVGYVKALVRGEEDAIGRVTVRALDDDRARNFAMELDAAAYDVASSANNERRMVSVTGKLVREPGRSLRFSEVSSFVLAGELGTGGPGYGKR